MSTRDELSENRADPIKELHPSDSRRLKEMRAHLAMTPKANFGADVAWDPLRNARSGSCRHTLRTSQSRFSADTASASGLRVLKTHSVEMFARSGLGEFPYFFRRRVAVGTVESIELRLSRNDAVLQIGWTQCFDLALGIPARRPVWMLPKSKV